MEKIEDYEVISAYDYFKGKTTDQIDSIINHYGSDEMAILTDMEDKYPEDKYFVLVDYIDDRNLGYFHIRVWKK